MFRKGSFSRYSELPFLIIRVEDLIGSRRAESRTVRPSGMETDHISALGSHKAVFDAGGITGAGCVTTEYRTRFSMLLACGIGGRPQGAHSVPTVPHVDSAE